MLRWTVTLLTVGTLITGCAGIRMNARKPVEGSTSGVVSSPYGPEGGERCSEVGRASCPYMNISFSTVQAACSKRVVAEAEAAGANYIHVNEPKQSVGGFATRSPKAIFYDCASLDQ